jgi:hypothetical protein
MKRILFDPSAPFVVILMIGKRGHLAREEYRRHYGEADEIAAMVTGAIRAVGPS